MTIQRMPGLIDEAPITVYPTVAKYLGINKATILQQLHFLLNVTRAKDNQDNFFESEYWIYNTYEQWQEFFPWLEASTIKRLFLELEKDGLIISRHTAKSRTRTKWYRIDYSAWTQFVLSMGARPVKAVSNKSTNVSKRDDATYQNDTDNVSKRDVPIYTENTQREKEKDSAPQAVADIGSEKKPKQPRPRNPLFDIVAKSSFDIKDTTTIDRQTAGRIAKISTWLAKQKVAPERLEQFYRWYDKETKGTSRPRDLGKFAERFTVFDQRPKLVPKAPDAPGEFDGVEPSIYGFYHQPKAVNQ